MSRRASAPTMGDVARAANVSLSTVSHVLNGTRFVSPAVEVSVREAMTSIGYRPNPLARALAGSRSNTIAAAISGLTNHYFSETIRAIESACTQRGLMMFFADTHENAEHELNVVQAMHHRRVDGIILAASGDGDQRAIDYVRTHRIPTVLIDRLADGRLDQVGVENERSTARLITHLIGHGHRRIGMVSGAAGLSTTEERVAGYRAALTGAGIGFDPALVRSGQSRIEPARLAARELLALPDRPTAIMSSNNLMTIGVLHALQESGARVPQDVAFVGFDDFDWADVFSPRLTVMAQPLEDLGARAVDLLMARIADPGAAAQTVRLDPVLRVRNSCGCG